MDFVPAFSDDGDDADFVAASFTAVVDISVFLPEEAVFLERFFLLSDPDTTASLDIAFSVFSVTFSVLFLADFCSNSCC